MEAPKPRTTRKEALAAARVDSCKPPAEWSSLALAGLFIECWEKHYEIEYRHALNTTLGHVEKLREDQGELAYWCIEAVFSEDMNWVKANRLDFLSNPSNCQKWIAPIALNQRKAAGGEIVRDTSSIEDIVEGGIVHDPLNRR